MARNAPRAMRKHPLTYLPDAAGVQAGVRDPPAWALVSAHRDGDKVVLCLLVDHPTDEWQSARFAVDVPLRIDGGVVEVGRALAREMTDRDYDEGEEYDDEGEER